MKLRLFITLVILLAASTDAFGRRQETLIHGRVDHGGYGSFGSKFTTVNDKAEVLLGARGGWILDHTFSLGLAGYGLLTPVSTHYPVSGRPMRLEFGYIGVELAWIINSDRLIHYEVSTLIGHGGIHYYGTHGDDDPRDDGFFVVEPGARVVLNIWTFCRASAGVSYRWVDAVDFEEALSDSQLSGPAISLMLNFGQF